MPTQEEIHAVATEIETSGEKVTLAAVRAKLAERFGGGGGSYTTISEALKRWRSERKQQERAPELPIPETVREAMELAGRKIHQAALEVAHGEIEAMKSALELKERELNQERAEALALADQLGEDLERTREERTALAAKLEDAQERGAKASALAEERKERLHVLEATAKTARQETEALRQEATQLTERLANRDTEITAMKTALGAKEEERVKALALSEELRKELERLKEEKAGLATKLEDAQERDSRAATLAEEYKERIGKLERAVTNALENGEALRTEHARLSERLANRDAEAKRLQQQVSELQAKLVSPKTK
ncbi:DNA-binding protein [Thiocystis violacea]|uniref:DNA-binding protein n=1 Tax=Thiocystis violacea TaxID=13725 RepID=UPI0019077E57|nr:DNA-binding protein [Thiocystis violacea]MBK1724141.1 hypothetical protein [Thiocystis violacea]